MRKIDDPDYFKNQHESNSNQGKKNSTKHRDVELGDLNENERKVEQYNLSTTDLVIIEF
jgi:hypothetical protein